MSDAATPVPENPLMQMMQANAPETVADLRTMLDGFAGMMNADLPEVGAFHDSVPVEGLPDVTADIVVPTGEGPWNAPTSRRSAFIMPAKPSSIVRRSATVSGAFAGTARFASRPAS